MSVSFNPIGPWYVVLLVSLVVMVLTIWAYQQRLKGTSGRWRWLALGLRLAALLLCFLAALRPSVMHEEKKKQPATLLFLLDDSSSMQLTDEASGKSRWWRALETLGKARDASKRLGPNLQVKFYRFNAGLREQATDEQGEAKGRETALGAALIEAVKRQTGMRVARIIVLADGANNAGLNPLAAANTLRSQQIPVDTVGFGTENAGPASRDIAVRSLDTATVFVKNQLLVRSTLAVRGFANQPIDVEMYVEGQNEPVARTTIKAPEGSEVVPITGLKYIPQTPGEKRITIKAKPKDGELTRNNNEISTFITVLSGGLNVLYIQGPHSPWEQKYWMRAVAASPDIQADLRIVRRSAAEGRSELDDADFAPGKYNVYVLSDLPADYLSTVQQQLLTRAVEKGGAGVIMLGGRSSFGSGGWADTSVARILPVNMHPGDGQLEPEGGIKFVPSFTGPGSFLFQVGADVAESRRIWDALPPITGTNRFTGPKLNAIVLGHANDRRGEPVMVAMSPGSGRSLAFGGETWVWARDWRDEGRLAHRKFWRQVIFWLAHKEDQGENKIKLALERRRVAVGQKLDVTVTARDAKDAPIPDVKYETRVTREGANGAGESVPLYNEGEKARGSVFDLGQPGEYKITVTASRQGKEIGRDSARFIVYQDDREMENPAADLAQLRQVATITGGTFLPPEKLPGHLRSLDGKMFTEYVHQQEVKVWDNWPFFLIFTALLTLEWWLRKRNGWV